MEKQKKYKRLKFYYVDEDYANYLRQNYDARVPNISANDYKNKKFFIGILMKINGFEYLAPVSSYTQENPFTFNIKDRDGTIISSVRPNYMFPVVDDVRQLVPMQKINAKYYKHLLDEEIHYCNKHRAEICELAQNIYDTKTSYSYSTAAERKTYEAMCCNFKHLEQGAKAYQDKESKLLSERERTLIDKYPIDAQKILQIKTLRAKFINAQPDQFAALEQCIRTNIKLAPEIYGKEISDRIAKEDRSANKKPAAAKAVAKAPEKKPVSKTQEKITKKTDTKKKPQRSR
ncbi:MAG: type III toxin-antitoxin system ToxN/AbiQ family toxin [Prevotella sp.]|nr:type III toxin-antitoxin system ToxN/AbiQ family toxin [Prevotella sp.]